MANSDQLDLAVIRSKVARAMALNKLHGAPSGGANLRHPGAVVRAGSRRFSSATALA
jgi:hypothetical protein